MRAAVPPINRPWYMRLFFALPDGVLGVLDPNSHSYDDLWRAAGLHAAVPHLESLELESQTTAVAELRATYALRSPTPARSSRTLALHELRIRVHADGEVELLNEACVPVAVPSLPRVGLLLGLPARLERCRWFGLGPHENYVDRQRGATLAVHSAAVDELFTPYLVPGECGHRGGLRWLEVSDAVGAGVRVSGAGGPLGFSLLRHARPPLPLPTPTGKPLTLRPLLFASVFRHARPCPPSLAAAGIVRRSSTAQRTRTSSSPTPIGCG